MHSKEGIPFDRLYVFMYAMISKKEGRPMENNANQIDMEIIDSLFEELNKKIDEDSIIVTDAACNMGGCPIEPLRNGKLTLAW